MKKHAHAVNPMSEAMLVLEQGFTAPPEAPPMPQIRLLPARFNVETLFERATVPAQVPTVGQALADELLALTGSVAGATDPEQLATLMVALGLMANKVVNDLNYPESSAGQPGELQLVTSQQLSDCLSDQAQQITALQQELQGYKDRKSGFPLHIAPEEFAKLEGPARDAWRKATSSADTLVDFFNWAYEQKRSVGQLNQKVENQKKALVDATSVAAKHVQEIQQLKAGQKAKPVADPEGQVAIDKAVADHKALAAKLDSWMADYAKLQMAHDALEAELEQLKQAKPAVAGTAPDPDGVQLRKIRGVRKAIKALADAGLDTSALTGQMEALLDS